ncbi:unnamed protein product [Nesidiocoris tenuis]|uniref:Uncharacterized protein n=1 Tax=Nesidiocoris tenuis TaxID=355587 RepID=A0A6H5GGV9_9HEMI|nr:unnamed protein product [Nesidiocoris tenuis]
MQEREYRHELEVSSVSSRSTLSCLIRAPNRLLMSSRSLTNRWGLSPIVFFSKESFR